MDIPTENSVMHIIHLYDGHEKVFQGKGSVPNVVWNLARQAVESGHEVTVIERQWEGLPASASHENVSFERMSLRTGPSVPWSRVPYEQVQRKTGIARLITDRTNFALRALRRLYRREVDVIHVHLPFAANVLITIAPWLRHRMVYTAHLGELRLNLLSDEKKTQSATEPNNHPSNSRDRDDVVSVDVPGVLSLFSPDVFLSKRVARTTVLNPAIKSAFEEKGVPSSKLDVIPNGVDIDRFATMDGSKLKRVRGSYGLDTGPVVLFVGTIMPRKGVQELIEALALARPRLESNPHVVIAGEKDLDEPYRYSVERLISKHDLDSHVSMPGFVPAEDLPALYNLADVFVLPSLEEGFGMTAIEALAAGTPVIGSRVGGLPYLLEDFEHGWLVTPGDVDDLADALVDALGKELNANSVEQIQSQAREFSWPTIANQFISVYNAVST